MMSHRSLHQEFKSKGVKAARKLKKRKSTSKGASNMNSSSRVSFTASKIITMIRDNSMMTTIISIGTQLHTDMGKNSSFMSPLLRNTGSNNTLSQMTYSISRESLFTKQIMIATPWNLTSLKRNSPSNSETSNFQAAFLRFLRVLYPTLSISTGVTPSFSFSSTGLAS